MLSWIDDDEPLPPTTLALGPDSDAPGLLAAGGSLTPQRLEQAYRRGIFPWFSPGQPVLWWSPDPRMVLPVAQFKVSKSLAKTLRRFVRAPGSELRIDSAFARVIEACAHTPRDGQGGTWIVPQMVAAYTAWHRLGRVHSFETWIDGRLVGGLYGVAIGRMFFGESMFALGHRRVEDRTGGAGGFLPAPRHRADRLPAEHRPPGFAGRARDAAQRLRAAPVPRARGSRMSADWSYDSRMWLQLEALQDTPL